MDTVYATIIVVLLILIILFIVTQPERFRDLVDDDVPNWHFTEVKTKFEVDEHKRRKINPDRFSYMKLYEGFDQKDLAFEFAPFIDYTNNVGQGFLREIIKINLKSVDINLPRLGNQYDEIRRIELWAVDDTNENASMESSFYNVYLEPEYTFRANPARYQRIIQVLPGDHAKLDIVEPVKRVFVIAIL